MPTWLPSSDRALNAAHQAAIDPATWLPAAGAVALGISGLDDNVTDWASDETPLFGNQERASNASDHLRDGLKLGMAATAMFAPINGAYRQFPGRRLAANALAIVSSEETVQGLKDLVGRERPDESNDKSFPSNHTVEAVASATLIRRNLAPSIQPPKIRASFNAAMVGAGALVGWARIEADKHYPSDVLTSAALGNFFAQSFYLALVDDEDAPSVQFTPEPDGLTLIFAKTF
ncbi:MAG: phosphatase PAP2 family protein [Geminicoccaceae bacterium]